jgi:phage-related baseplate assembly protein
VTYDHDSCVTVQASTVGIDRAIPAGTVVRTGGEPDIKVSTGEDAVLYDGDYQVVNVAAASQESGTETNVAAGMLTIFESAPFPTATVINPGLFYGGSDYETDEDLRARIKASQQALSSSTRRRIEAEALSVQIPETGQRVITAKLVEPIDPGESVLHINDGTTTYSPTTDDILATEFLIPNAEAGEKRAIFHMWPLVDDSEKVYLSKDKGVATSVDVAEINDTAKAWTPSQWAGGDFIVKDENGSIWEIDDNTATQLQLVGSGTPVLGVYAIIDISSTVYPTGSLLTKDTDYIINNTNGNLELIGALAGGLALHDCLASYSGGVSAAYSYYTGLLQKVQRTLNGDPADFDTYPGVIAAGSKVSITAPAVQVVTVEAAIVAIPGVAEATLYDSVKRAILNYINNLPIGGDVLRSRILDAAISITGVYDVTLSVPASNVPITDTQLAKTTLDDIVVT